MAYYQGGYHQNPAYTGTAEKQGQLGGQPPMSNVVMMPEAPSYSWCTPCWGLISLWCCGFYGWTCGLLGLFFSTWSYSDHKAGDYDRSAHKKRWAIGCVIIAIFMGLLTIAAILVVYFVFKDELCEFVDDNGNGTELRGICD